MKKVFVTLFLIAISVSSFSQRSYNEIINALRTNIKLALHDDPEEIIRFNKDTILVAGYLEELHSENANKTYRHNIVYKTCNSGKDWKTIKFMGDAWIYTSTHLNDGKVWMGGSDEYIHYSEDYGETWKRINKPFIPNDRISSIYMKDGQVGIAGGLSNGLAVTYDNWETTIQIPTPQDQGKFQIPNRSSKNRVENIGIFDSLILIDQNGHIYYSKLDSINWQELILPTLDFTINEDKNGICLKSVCSWNIIVNTNLQWISKYSNSDSSIFSLSVINQNIDLNSFFEYPIKAVEIKSIEYIPKNDMIVSYKKKTQIAGIRKKRNNYIYYLPENYYNQQVNCNLSDFKSILNRGSFNTLSQEKENLKFNEEDLINYNDYLSNEVAKFNEREKFGDNQSILIKPSHIIKYNAKDIDSIIRVTDLEYLFSNNSFTLDFLESNKNHFEIKIKNDNNDKIIISNIKSVFFSLPWTITYKGKSTYCYDPELTHLVRKILPPEFNNYNLLLGGELIYRVYETDIINNILKNKKIILDN